MSVTQNLILTFIGLASSLVYGASYSVPVPENLQSQATWNAVTAEAHAEGDTLTVTYKLPEDLVGKNSPGFVATGTGTGSFIPVNGDDVYGYCMKSKEKPLECMVKYPRSIVDLATRDQSLLSHFTGIQLEARMKVARLFGADPAGLLTVELN